MRKFAKQTAQDYFIKKGDNIRKILNKHNHHDSEKTIQKAIKMSVHCTGAFHVGLFDFTFVYPFYYIMTTINSLKPCWTICFQIISWSIQFILQGVPQLRNLLVSVWISVNWVDYYSATYIDFSFQNSQNVHNVDPLY